MNEIKTPCGSHERADSVFALVSPVKRGRHWKDAIRELVPAADVLKAAGVEVIGSEELAAREARKILTDVVIFFTGSVPTFESRTSGKGKHAHPVLLVRAAGYWAAVGS